MAVYRQTIEAIVKQNRYTGTGEYPSSPEEWAALDYLAVKDSQGNVIKTAQQVRTEDLETLFHGIQTTQARVTRLRADLTHASLDQDLQLTASADQKELATTRQITKEKNQPLCPVWDGCSSVGTAPRDEAIARSTPASSATGSSCAVTPSSGNATFMAAGFGVFGLALTQAMRRRRR